MGNPNQSYLRTLFNLGPPNVHATWVSAQPTVCVAAGPSSRIVMLEFRISWRLARCRSQHHLSCICSICQQYAICRLLLCTWNYEQWKQFIHQLCYKMNTSWASVSYSPIKLGSNIISPGTWFTSLHIPISVSYANFSLHTYIYFRTSQYAEIVSFTTLCDWIRVTCPVLR